MESTKIYEDSKEELKKIYKSMGNSSLEINFDKLDTKTRDLLTTAISNVVSKRMRDIDAVILGVQ